MLPSSYPRRRAGGGHTLMELMVVMALLAVAAWLLLPITARAYAGFRLRLAADSIVRLLQQAKNRSLFEGRTYLVILPDPANREQGRELILAQEDGVSVGHYSLPIDISLTARQGEGDWSSTGGTVAFYPDGTSDPVQFVLQNASKSASRIQLDPRTARARIVLASEVEP